MLDVLGAVHLPDVAGPDVFGGRAHGPDRIVVVVGEVGQCVVKQELPISRSMASRFAGSTLPVALRIASSDLWNSNPRLKCSDLTGLVP